MGTPPASDPLADELSRVISELRGRLPELMLRDERRLSARLDGVRRLRDPTARQRTVASLAAAVEGAASRAQARRAAVPTITYPAQLPISQRRDEIAAAIRDHQVVIVAGETGSGKTTQLPKICLELGRGVRGAIGHTQPRRIAARSVADRIAEELAVPLGGAVGYTVRFTDQVSESTLVKVMTDGILLAEIRSDRMLERYDTLIIDEAHERSLNIDFILGYLKQLLPKRRDLKVVITSATIDPQRFSRHFDNAPVIEVSGRTYPVELRYRPLVEETEVPAAHDDTEPVVRDQVQAICEAVQELITEPSRDGSGDILVFLSGEREIRDAADELARMNLRGTELLPLYARLSAAEQHRVFSGHEGRRIVLATNVAETSLTVPGIRYVVDPGTARISRYSYRTKVQRLPIEAISQASANQRAGRCGRVADGICIRLYSEQDLAARPEFTDPEILRTNLASVILQMAALGLGDVAAFGFVDPPDRRSISDGIQLLQELGALDPTQQDPRKRLTPLGRRLAQLPVDPRLGRMILEADRLGCVREVMVIAAALSIQDPRERPTDQQQAADERHRRFADDESDFLTYLKLWEYLREQQKERSSSGFRRMCKGEFLNYVRIREWQDLVAQLKQVASSVGVTLSASAADVASTADRARIHQALLAGLLSHLGLKDPDTRDYLGARCARFAIFPGSGVFRKRPQWVMAAELVETSRLWGRVVARIEPEWAEELAAHLAKRSYSEPHWEAKRAAVMAQEKVTLYGVPIVASRSVGYGRVDPVLARELFIRHALVEGDWRTHHAFFQANRGLLEDVEELENRARRRDILVDDETLYAFYDARIPPDVTSGRHFDAWWKVARRSEPELLTFTEELLVNDDAAGVSTRDYPDTWQQNDLALALTYQFEPGVRPEPGQPADGVTVHVPVSVLNRVAAADFEWQIPGLRAQLMTALIRALPKALRVNFVPAPDHARAVEARLRPREERLAVALSRELRAMTGSVVPVEAWDFAKVPDHLRVTFRVEGERVEGERERVLAEGKDLDELRARLLPKVRAAVAEAGTDLERPGLRAWSGGSLPRQVERARDGLLVKGFPALVDEGETVAIRVLATREEQERAMWAGTRRLLLLGAPPATKPVLGRLDTATKLLLSAAPHAGASALFDDCAACAVDSIVAGQGGPAWDGPGHARLLDAVRGALPDALHAVVSLVAQVLSAWQDVDRRLAAAVGLSLLASTSDVRDQVARLVYPGFVAATGRHRLPDVIRYLRAADRRLEVLAQRPERDARLLEQLRDVESEYAKVLASFRPGTPVPAALRDIRWMIEEFRVSLFAQTLGTAYPVSEKRIFKAIGDALDADLVVDPAVRRTHSP